jgi:hypothetical protein
MHFGGFGIFGILIFIADIWAILNVAQSTGENLTKAVWIVVILLLPLLGLVLWYLFGPRSSEP